MDVAMPGGGGLDATRQIAAAQPGDGDRDAHRQRGRSTTCSRRSRPGARGYLLKNLEAAELRGMLEAVERGEAAITPAIAARIMAELRPPRGTGADARAARTRTA